jgi:hypothetical protein
MPGWPAPACSVLSASPLDRYVKYIQSARGWLHMPPSSIPSPTYSFLYIFTCEDVPTALAITYQAEFIAVHPPFLPCGPFRKRSCVNLTCLLCGWLPACVAVLSATDGTCWDLLLLLWPRVSLLCAALCARCTKLSSALHCSCVVFRHSTKLNLKSIALHQGYTA